MMFVAGDRIQQKKNAFGRVWVVVDLDSSLPRSATPPKKGSIIAVVLETWVDKSLPVFMYASDFEKVGS